MLGSLQNLCDIPRMQSARGPAPFSRRVRAKLVADPQASQMFLQLLARQRLVHTVRSRPEARTTPSADKRVRPRGATMLTEHLARQEAAGGYTPLKCVSM